jgi:hypothetical protein
MCSYHADALEIDIFYDEDRVAATWAIGTGVLEGKGVG